MEFIDYQAVMDDLTKTLDRYTRISHARKFALTKAIGVLRRYMEGTEAQPPDLSEWVNVADFRKQAAQVEIADQPTFIAQDTLPSGKELVEQETSSPAENLAMNEEFGMSWLEELAAEAPEDLPQQVTPTDTDSETEPFGQAAEEEQEAAPELSWESLFGQAAEETQEAKPESKAEFSFGQAAEETQETKEQPAVASSSAGVIDDAREEEVEEENIQSNRHFLELLQKAASDLRGDDEALKRAILALENLEQTASLPDANRTQVASTLSEARGERTRRVEALLEKGRQASKNHLDEEARQAFAAVYKLDSGNQQVNDYLSALNAAAARTSSESEINYLQTELSVRNDLIRLEKAVRQAELLWSEGRLPDRLRNTMQEARTFFDARRAFLKLIPTNAMIGELKESFKAIAKIEDLIENTVEKSFPDPYTEDLVDIHTALRNARLVWSDRSLEYVEDTRKQVEKYLEQEPRIARNIFQRRLGDIASDKTTEPVHEKAVAAVEVIREKVRRRNDEYDEAQKKSDEADAASDALIGLSRCIEAASRFPHLPGLQEKTARYRQQALDFLEMQVNNQFTALETSLNNFQFDNAKEAVLEAQKLITRWPEQNKPDILQRMTQECATYMGRIGQAKSKHEEFENQYQLARKLESEGKLPEALSALRNLFADERFNKDKRYTRYKDSMKDLIRKVSATQSQEERLSLARVACANSEAGENEWEQVFELTKGLKAASDEAKALNARADMMLRVAEVKDLVKAAGIAEAKEKIDLLGRRYPGAAPLVAQEEAIIQAALTATPAFKKLYEEASQQAKKSGVTERAAALRIFRYLTGAPVNGSQTPVDWPAYSLTLYTAQSRDRVHELSKQLRENDLPELLQVHKRYIEENAEPRPDQRKSLSEKARALRSVYLLENEDERSAARWLEISQGKADADGVAALGNWNLAVEMWEELDMYYPRTPVIRKGLRNSYIQQALQRARSNYSQGEPEKALLVLQQAESEHDLLDELEVRLALAQAHEKLGNFDEAIEILKLVKMAALDADQRAQVERERKRLIREGSIATALNQVQALQQEAELSGTTESDRRKWVREALLVLRDANVALGSTGSTRLEREFSNLHVRETNQLIHHIEAQLAKKTPAGNLEALLSSVDLEQVEDIKGVDDKSRSSRSFQKQLEGEPLGKLINHLAQKWNELNPDDANPNFAFRGTQASVYDTDSQKEARYSTITAAQIYDQVSDLKDKIVISSRLIKTLDENGKEMAKSQAASMMSQYKAKLDSFITPISMLLDGLRDLLKKDLTGQAKNSDAPWQDAVLIDETPNEWELAVAGDTFDRLDGILAKLKDYKLHQVRDVQIFTLRLKETKQVHEHLKKGISSIRIDFKDEKFARVVATIEALRRMHSMENSDDLVYIDDGGYQQIYQWIGVRLRVVGNDASGDMRGWEAVCSDAAHREHNYRSWEDWLGQPEAEQKNVLQAAAQRGTASYNLALRFRLEIPWRGEEPQAEYQNALNCDALPPNSRGWIPALMVEHAGVYKQAFTNPKGEGFSAELVTADQLPLRFCVWAWENAETHLKNILEELDRGPRPANPGSPDAQMVNFPALSAKAVMLKEQAIKVRKSFKTYFDVAQQQLSFALAQIEAYGSFPLPGEAIQLQKQKNLSKMKDRYAQARKIGPANPSEARSFFNMKDWIEQQAKKKRFGIF